MSDHAIDKAPNTTYTETSSYGTKPTFGSKAKAFCRRFWWVLLIGFVSSNLIIILCLAYVGLPNIAQAQVNKSTLEVKNMIVIEPTKNSVRLQQEAFLHSSSIFTPTLDAFPVALFLENTEPNIKPFAYLQLPRVHSSKSTPVNLDQTVSITDIDQFSEYTKAVMNNEKVRLALRGRTVLRLGKLPPATVNYNEVLEFNGLNKLSGFDILTAHIVASTNGGPNLIGTASIPNPSYLTLQMGNVTYDLYANNTHIGTSLMPNLTLKPGNNTVDMQSTVDLLLVAKLATPTAGILHLEVRGNSSVYNGQHLPYYEAAIQSNPMHIVLDTAKAKAG
ncbi:MAG: hypothetical protein M1839_002624 [Geoglossum umbratile]|nr:MAG: hypothetical protein M1839_002624 [Geoglossum umbratile]